MLLERQHLLLIDLGLLEVHPLRSFGHQALIMLDDLSASAFEELYDLLYIFIVFLLRNASDAASKALPDMKIETRTELSTQNRIRCDLMLACTQRIHIMKELHEVTRMHDAAVRAEIP